DDERAGRAADLGAATAEGADDEPGDDGGIDPLLRLDARRDGERDGERQGDDADDNAGDEVLEELLPRVASPEDRDELRLETGVRGQGSGAEAAEGDVA